MANNGGPILDKVCQPTSITRSQGKLAQTAYRFQREITEDTVYTWDIDRGDSVFLSEILCARNRIISGLK